MKKFAVCSGFLGSGKTTAMMALTRYLGNAAMISNDLGRQSLADHKLAKLAGCRASELTGDCICYMTETLVSRLEQLFNEGNELVISDIPGFGVGALDHVYHTLNRDYSDFCQLAPFTVLTEPRTVAMLRENRGGDLAYILNAQLLEADLIVLNKCDLLDKAQRQADLSWLREAYPHAKVMAISALTGEGMAELARELLESTASLHLPEIGYGGSEFGAAMGKISEFYIQYHAAVCCDRFDGTEYLVAMAEKIQTDIAAVGCDIPHLKLLAWEPEGDYGKVDLLGVDRPVQVTREFAKPCTEVAVMLNGSAACPGKVLEKEMMDAVEQISEAFHLTLMVFRKECFGMGD